MKCVMKKKPKGATVVLGFPGLGLVSTIASKFILDHIQADPIGHISIDEQAPLVAVHDGKLVQPISLYYNKQYNLVIVQSLTEVANLEWQVADVILKMCKDIQAKELIILESTPTREADINVMCFANKKAKPIKGIEPLKNAILMGLTSAILLRAKTFPVRCLFAEVHSNLPEHEAAAKVVESLDNHLGLKVDFKPLLKQAQEFEANVRQMVDQKREMEAQRTAPSGKQTYIG